MAEELTWPNSSMFVRRLKKALKRSLPGNVVLNIRKFRNVKWIEVHEPPEFSVMKHLIAGGDTVIDIGANMGEYSRPLSALVGPRGRVFSIEPVPQTFEVLVYIVKKLGLSNTNPVECAISDVEGVSRMVIPRDDGGEENFYEAVIVENSFHSTLPSIRVKTRVLDSVVPPSGEISFVKCDVEGHELHCIKGAKEIIRNSHPAWYIETKGNPDEPDSISGQLFKEMGQEGYSPCIFDGRDLRIRRVGESAINYFFLTKSHMDKLSTLAPSLMVDIRNRDHALVSPGVKL